MLFFCSTEDRFQGLGQLKEQEGEVLTEPFSTHFNVCAHAIWLLRSHHLLCNIRTCFSSLCVCGILQFGGGGKYISLFLSWSKHLHCCRSSRQWIVFKEKSYSSLACGAADPLCFSFKEHLNLPWVQFREQFFAARPGVRSVSSITSSPSLTLP